MHVELEDDGYVGGESVRALVTGTGAFRWALTWRASGGQPATDHTGAAAEGRGVATAMGAGIELRLPVGAAPSHPGALVAIAWRLDVWPEGHAQPVRTSLHVQPGPAPRRLDPWIRRWRAWKRRRAGGMAAATLFVVGIAVACVAAAGVFAAGALSLPPLQATAIFAVLALAGVGAVATAREVMPGFLRGTRARSRIRLMPGPVALLGGELDAAVRIDARRAMAAGGFDWTLRCVERAATRITWLDRGQTRERYDWAVRVVTESTGSLDGPPYGARRFTISVPRNAPPTFTGEYREIRWELEVQCGEDTVTELVFVAPFLA